MAKLKGENRLLYREVSVLECEVIHHNLDLFKCCKVYLSAQAYYLHLLQSLATHNHLFRTHAYQSKLGPY